MEIAAAPELRTDWLTGRTVVLAEHRANRPNEFMADPVSAASSESSNSCPFCRGHEVDTPPAVETRNDERGKWRVRVVPNMYPVVMQPELGVGSGNVAVEGVIPATGAHEVIIESARHLDRTASLSIDEFKDVLAVYVDRLGYWHDARVQDGGQFEYGLVFKNVGSRAGASLAHLHSQFIALPKLPPAVAGEFQRAEEYCAKNQKCAYCDLIASERAAGERVVFEREGYIAFCPYVSLQPCEVWVMPTEHEPWFERQSRPAAVDRLAELLHPLLARLESTVPQGTYNLLVRTAPWCARAATCGHWRIEILPRVNPLAGLELGTGIHINPISPTRAAKQLRLS
jgi:UDPglucose--hexose-1-phosphate uridylyltransferase